MADKLTLYGFEGSTYVRAARTLLHAKGADYDLVPVSVFTGEQRQPEHLARHPFGKIPVLEVDGMRVRETDAICRYLDETLPGPSFIPDNARGRARMAEAINLINSYGYGALIGLAGYHLFPDFLGGPTEEMRRKWLADSEKVLKMLMELRGDDRWIAGQKPSLADFFLAPLIFYVSLTPDADKVMSVPGMADWWKAVNEIESFKATEPNLG